MEARRIARRRGVDGNTIRYAPTSLEMLNDHPVLLGEHFRSITLWPADSPVGEHVIDVVADSDWALQFPQSRIDIYKKIVLEERAVFGGVGHYRKYHWLLTLSDNLGAFGVEHHECADDRVAENTFVDDDAAKRSSLLLPHEFFHSWNGKARRPTGLVTRRLRTADEGRSAVGLRGADQLLRRAARRARGPDLREEWLDELAADAMARQRTRAARGGRSRMRRTRRRFSTPPAAAGPAGGAADCRRSTRKAR